MLEGLLKIVSKACSHVDIRDERKISILGVHYMMGSERVDSTMDQYRCIPNPILTLLSFPFLLPL